MASDPVAEAARLNQKVNTMSAWNPPSPDTLVLARNLRQLAEERLSREHRIAIRRSRPVTHWHYRAPLDVATGNGLWWVAPTLWGIEGVFAFSFSDDLSYALVRVLGL